MRVRLRGWCRVLLIGIISSVQRASKRGVVLRVEVIGEKAAKRLVDVWLSKTTLAVLPLVSMK